MSNTGRFNVGEKYIFVRTLFDPHPDSFGRLYCPWRDKLIGIEVVTLICIEHHKVAWDQDPKGEKKCDGYLFKDEEGDLWENQYPHASYGQLDDSQDRMVRRYFKTKELLEVDDKGETKKDEKGNYIRKNLHLWAIFEKDLRNPMNLATGFIENVYEAIHPAKNIVDKGWALNEVQKDSMKVYLEQLKGVIEREAKQKIEFHPWVIELKDGRKVTTEQFEVKFV